MEALLPSAVYVNQVAAKQALIPGGPYFLDSTAEITLSQYAPASDIAAGNWTPSSGGSLYAMLNESVADDGTYIQSGLSPSGDIATVKFAAAGAPAVRTNHKVRYRIRAQGTVNMTVALMQGLGTTIASWSHTPAPSSYTTFEQALTEGEATNITDYSDLRLKVTAG